MASEFDNQLKQYSENRKLKFENSTRNNNDTSTKNETSTLLQETNLTNNPPITIYNWVRSKFNGCGFLPDRSFKVMTLPVLNGVPLHIHSLWLIFIFLSTLGALQISLLFGLYSFMLGGPVLFLSVLIHELGHAAMAVSLGGQVDRILLWPLGGLAYISFFGESNPRADALIAIAGPLTHLPQVAVWMSLMALSTGGVVQLTWPLSWGFNFWIGVCAGAVCIQIALFLFNLIPAYPLDGGRLFGALLQYMNVDKNRSFQVSAILGAVIGGLMFVIAVRSIAESSFSYFGGWNLLYLSLFILGNCYQLWVLGSSGNAGQHPGFERVN